jgi:3-oxoacyl-[acyl-carrier-protein] synthase-3
MGLMIADSFLQAGTYRHVLLAAGEVHSSGLDYSERGARVAALYGDGAAVTLLGHAAEGCGLRAVVCHSDGRLHDRFWCEYPASRQHPVRITVDDVRAGRQFPTLDFDTVERFGREHLPAAVREALAAAQSDVDSVDCFVLSHILPEVAESAAAALALPRSRWINAGEAHGHLTAATLPVALSEAVGDGRLGKGATVCLAACGAGFAWGSAVLTL